MRLIRKSFRSCRTIAPSLHVILGESQIFLEEMFFPNPGSGGGITEIDPNDYWLIHVPDDMDIKNDNALRDIFANVTLKYNSLVYPFGRDRDNPGNKTFL